MPIASLVPGELVLATNIVTGKTSPEPAADPQHVGLVSFLQVPPQFGAAAVDLVAADEVEGQAVGARVIEDVDSQLALGAEPQARREARGQGFNQVPGVLCDRPPVQQQRHWTHLFP